MYTIIRANKIGSSHVKENTCCQDKIYSYQDDDFNIISCSDGAGSCKYSHFGAEVVTQNVVNFIKNHFDKIYETLDNDVILKNLQGYLLFQLEEKRKEIVSEGLECDLRDLSCTLLCAAVKGDKYITLHIGDGVIALVKKDKLEVISVPTNAEFSNVTVFVTSPKSYIDLKVQRGTVKTLGGFILMTDGPEAKFYIKKTNQLSPYFLKLYQKYLNKEENLDEDLEAKVDRIIELGVTDDCSVICMYKEIEEVEEDEESVTKDVTTEEKEEVETVEEVIEEPKLIIDIESESVEDSLVKENIMIVPVIEEENK